MLLKELNVVTHTNPHTQLCIKLPTVYLLLVADFDHMDLLLRHSNIYYIQVQHFYNLRVFYIYKPNMVFLNNHRISV